jgi:AraC family transcriptional activator of pobA
MNKKTSEKSAPNLSPTEFAQRFLVSAGNNVLHRTTEVQVFDYKWVAAHLKIPTILHRPDYNYVLILRDGFIIIQIGVEIKRIEGPATLFISAGQLISVQGISDNIEGTLVILEKESLNRVFSETDLLKILQTPPVVPLSDGDRKMVNDIGQLLLAEYSSAKPELQILISLVQALLYKLLKHSSLNQQLTKNHLTALRFKELVYKNYEREKNIVFYTDLLNISENYLNRCTQLIFGKSAKRFILEVAILQSKLLLQDMEKGIADVAYELNFGDSSYFTRIFRKITGITPSTYKRQAISEQ